MRHPTKEQQKQIKRHRSSIKTSYLLLLYGVIVGLLLLTAFSSIDTERSMTDRIVMGVLFGGLSIVFMVVMYCTYRDRQIDVIEDGITESHEDML